MQINIDWGSVITSLVTAGIGSAAGCIIVLWKQWGSMRKDLSSLRRAYAGLAQDRKKWWKTLTVLRDDVNDRLFKQAVLIRILHQKVRATQERQKVIMLWVMQSSQDQNAIRVLERELAVIEAEDRAGGRQGGMEDGEPYSYKEIPRFDNLAARLPSADELGLTEEEIAAEADEDAQDEEDRGV